MYSIDPTPIPHYSIIIVAALSGSHIIFLILRLYHMERRKWPASSLITDRDNRDMAYRLTFATVKLISDFLALGLSSLSAASEWLYLLCAFSMVVALFIEARKQNVSIPRQIVPTILAAWLSPLVRIIIGLSVSRVSLPSFLVTACGLACEYLIECASMEGLYYQNWLLFHCRELVAAALFLTLAIIGAVMQRDLALLFGVLWILGSALVFPLYPVWVKMEDHYSAKKPTAGASTGMQRVSSHTASEPQQQVPIPTGLDQASIQHV